MLVHSDRGISLGPFWLHPCDPAGLPGNSILHRFGGFAEVNEDKACSTFYPFRPEADHQKLFAYQARCLTLSKNAPSQ